MSPLTRGSGLHFVSNISVDELDTNWQRLILTHLEEMNYNPAADLANPASSVFCSHRAGFVVQWDEVNNYKHIK